MIKLGDLVKNKRKGTIGIVTGDVDGHRNLHYVLSHDGTSIVHKNHLEPLETK